MTMLTVRPTRRNIFADLDRFFSDVFPTAPTFDRADEFAPRMDVRDSDDHLFLTFELPGMDKKDIKVNVRDNVLTVSGKREQKTEVKEDEFVRREIRSGSFCRSVTLPETVNADKVSADYKNGLLEISLEKLEEVKPKEIEVKIS